MTYLLIAILLTVFVGTACHNDETLSEVTGGSIMTRSEENVCSITTFATGQVREFVKSYLTESGTNTVNVLCIEGPIDISDISYIRDSLLNSIVCDSLSLQKAKLIDQEGQETYILWDSCFAQIPEPKVNTGNCVSIYLPNSITSLENYVFFGSAIRGVYNMNHVTNMGMSTFDHCSYLQKVDWPLTLTSIPDYTFRGCSDLSFDIPSHITYIGEGAFYECKMCEDLVLPNHLTYLGDASFAYTGIKRISSWPSTLIHMPNQCFAYCRDLTDVFIPETVMLGNSAFYECSSLENVDVACENSIDASMFGGCSLLKNLKLRKCYDIGSYVFKGYKNIEKLEIGTCQSIGVRTFQYCTSLKKVEIDTVQSVGNWAFEFCDSLVTVNFKGLVKSIGESAISFCPSVKEIILPEGLTDIGIWAFHDCPLLEELTIPSTVINVEREFVGGCYNLTAVIWKSQTALPKLRESEYINMLIYIPDGVEYDSFNKNIIRDGIADQIKLYADGGDFRCPQEFVASEILYQVDFSSSPWNEVYTGQTPAARWRGLVLPFDVQTISSENQGRLAPFYAEVEDSKPFWLRELAADGYINATSIQANKPYIYAMPNNPAYNPIYNINDVVTFSSKNVTIPVTPTVLPSSEIGPNNYRLTSNYQTLEQNNYTFCLNDNTYDDYKNNAWPAGSIFSVNRAGKPFEAIILKTNLTRYGQISLGIRSSRAGTKMLEEIPQPDDM